MNDHSFDISLYYNDYDKLRGISTSSALEFAPAFTYAVFPVPFVNDVSGEAYGGDALCRLVRIYLEGSI